MSEMFVRFKHQGRECLGTLDGAGEIAVMEGSLFADKRPTGECVALSSVRLLSPLAASRIFGIGNNYYQAIRQANGTVPDRPLVFTKPSTAVVGSNENVIYPRGSNLVLFEGELVVVIGRQGRHIPKDEAAEYIFGYTCGNDLTERTLQQEELKAGSMCLSKGFDTFAALGPAIATEIDPTGVSIISRVNGELRQKGHTSDMVFDVSTLIAHLSAAITLLPGDVIMTGTPAGFGPIIPGDQIEIELPGIGILKNTVVAE
jgi:2-keto-4-pentenoate hydratase/2-oxohepta-3-ene-1,7-dioic acid hydratase in catechol pathway